MITDELTACEEAFVSLKVRNSGEPAVSIADIPLNPRMHPVNVKLSLVNVNEPNTGSTTVISEVEIPDIGLSTVIVLSSMAETLVLDITTISLPLSLSTTPDIVTMSLTLIFVVVIPVMIVSYLASIAPLLVPIGVKFLLFPV